MKNVFFCGACVDSCPEGAIMMDSETSITIDVDKCTCCLECEESCPVEALCIIVS